MEKEGIFDGHQTFNNHVQFGSPPMERRAAFPGGAIPRGYAIYGGGNREDGTRNAGSNEGEISAAETTTAERGNQVAPDGGASSLPIDQSVGTVRPCGKARQPITCLKKKSKNTSNHAFNGYARPGGWNVKKRLLTGRFLCFKTFKG